jgi:uncharacterized RDD family membrane protein YckC
MFTIIGGDGKEYGPVSVEQIRAWIAAGRANVETKARAAGTDEWRRLGDFAEFGATGAAATPPLVDPAAAGTAAGSFTAAPVVLAGRGARLGAAFIDFSISSLCSLPGVLMMGPAFLELVQAAARGEQPDVNHLTAAGFMLGLGVAFLGWFAQFVVQVWMLSTRGQTIGKRIVGVKIVRFADNASAGFLHAWFLRNFVRGAIQMVPYLGVFFAIVDLVFIFGDQRRCLHDYIAGTKVVQA